VEHLLALRAIPGLVTFRPADANEVAEAYRVIMLGVRRPEGDEAGNRAQRQQVLHWLVGRPILAHPDRIVEVAEAYRVIMQLKHQPAVLALSRQPLPTVDREKYAPASGGR
jgi:transketolase